jgi:hypothetical protein
VRFTAPLVALIGFALVADAAPPRGSRWGDHSGISPTARPSGSGVVRSGSFAAPAVGVPVTPATGGAVLGGVPSGTVVWSGPAAGTVVSRPMVTYGSLPSVSGSVVTGSVVTGPVVTSSSLPAGTVVTYPSAPLVTYPAAPPPPAQRILNFRR